ncbi:MAG: hypothetical protein WD250_07330, partial [Egibacteraceae bacterium]
RPRKTGRPDLTSSILRQPVRSYNCLKRAARPSSLWWRVRMRDDVEWCWFRTVGLAGRSVGRDALPLRFGQRDVALGDLLVTTGRSATPPT